MAYANSDDPTVVTNCAALVLPANVGTVGCWSPTLNYGPGTNLYMSYTSFPDAVSPATEAVTTASITAKLAGTDSQKMIGPIIGQYALTPPSEQTDRINGLYFPKPTELNMAVLLQDTSDGNVAMARSSQRGGIKAHFWIVDRNGNWFGGQNGIFGASAILSLRLNLPTDELGLQTITGTIKALGFFDPRRLASPVAFV